MSEDTNNASLSPENSPTVMGGKKQARRLNSRPLLVAFIIAGILALTMGLVMVQRSNRAKAEVAMTSIKSAAAQARAVTIKGEGGVVETAVPTLPLVPLVSEKPPVTPPAPITPEPEKKPDTPAPPPLPPSDKPQEAKRLPEEVRMLRNKRLRQFEASIDSPIHVDLRETQSTQQDKKTQLANLEKQIALLGQQEAATYAERLAAVKVAAGGGSGEIDYGQRDDLSRMKQFSDSEENWLNPRTPTAPSTPNMIRTGFVIPATLVGGINSEVPGQIVGQVALDVCDSATGKHVLIPQGSKLIGQYSSSVQYGQSRLFVVWNRIVFPDDKELDIGSMPGSSGAGYSGFRDRVNNHYLRIFGSAIMMSAIVAGVEMSQDDSSTGDKARMSDALSEALGQQLGGVMGEMLKKNMNIAPTLEIRPGYRFNVMLVKDLVFDGPYRAFDYKSRDL